MQLGREQLYEQVWTEPILSIARSLSISDRGLAKICARHRIPTPGRGYWQRLRSGHRVRRKALPQLPTVEAHLAVIHVRRRAPLPQPEEPPGPVAIQQEFEARPENRLSVPERVDRFHPLIRQTREGLRGSREASTSDPRRHRSPRLDVEVAPGSVRRALRVLDTLIKALIARGFTVRAGENGSPKTVITIEGVEIQIRLEERHRLVEVTPSRSVRNWWATPATRREPTGELALRITDPEVGNLRRTWADGRRQRVESCLNAFIVGLVRASDARRRHLLWRAEEDRKWEEERRRREEERQRRLREEARVGELTRQVAAWQEARGIRHYAAALRRATAERDDLVSSGIAPWIEWVERYADRIDPLNDLEELVANAPLVEMCGQDVGANGTEPSCSSAQNETPSAANWTSSPATSPSAATSPASTGVATAPRG
jgi:hypothetical protein